MTTWTWDPLYAPSLDEEPKLLITGFGDGYQQRLGDGINNIRQNWALEFHGNDTDAQAMLDFLRTAGSTGASFDWIPPRASASIKVICRRWRRQVISKNANRVSATFEQAFET